MYTIVLTIHSVLRWIVIIAALITVVRSWSGWLGKKEWSAFDDKMGLIYSASLDIQVLLGLLLYFFFSPLTHKAFADFGAAMSNAALRYWAVEHIAMMLIGLTLVHIGRARTKKAMSPSARYRSAAYSYTVATLVILIGIPWPFFSYCRGLF